MIIEIGPVLIGLALSGFGILVSAAVEPNRAHVQIPFLTGHPIWAVRSLLAFLVLMSLGLYNIDAVFPCVGVGFTIGYLGNVALAAVWRRVEQSLDPMAGRDSAQWPIDEGTPGR